jgi:hypothetical protein
MAEISRIQKGFLSQSNQANTLLGWQQQRTKSKERPTTPKPRKHETPAFVQQALQNQQQQ